MGEINLFFAVGLSFLFIAAGFAFSGLRYAKRRDLAIKQGWLLGLFTLLPLLVFVILGKAELSTRYLLIFSSLLFVLSSIMVQRAVITGLNNPKFRVLALLCIVSHGRMLIWFFWKLWRTFSV